MPPLEFAALFRNVVAGEEGAWRELFQRYQPFVAAKARLRLRGRMADDHAALVPRVVTAVFDSLEPTLVLRFLDAEDPEVEFVRWLLQNTRERVEEVSNSARPA